MEPSVDTMDAREPRPFKINTYVHFDRAAYLKKLARDNSRKISAQLDLILREHEATNGGFGAVRETAGGSQRD